MNQALKTQTHPTMYFIGVTTGQSSIMKVFPYWMGILGRPEVRLEGVDLPLHGDAEDYRRAVAQIKHDPLSLGALVTAHKINLFEAARDMFDFVDPYGVTCGEVSSISKADGRLEGHAKDPITAGLSLDSILGSGYFARTDGDVLCLGAGGSTTAIIFHLLNKADEGDVPKRIVVVNRSEGRIESLRQMVARLGPETSFHWHVHTDPRRNDALLESLRPGSVVINATGMGKDLPGSPITDEGRFPKQGIAWELNYRGELQFLHQARAQEKARLLQVEDGWAYFIHGWTQVIAEVLHVEIDEHVFEKLSRCAAEIMAPAGAGKG